MMWNVVIWLSTCNICLLLGLIDRFFIYLDDKLLMVVLLELRSRDNWVCSCMKRTY